MLREQLFGNRRSFIRSHVKATTACDVPWLPPGELLQVVPSWAAARCFLTALTLLQWISVIGGISLRGSNWDSCTDFCSDLEKVQSKSCSQEQLRFAPLGIIFSTVSPGRGDVLEPHPFLLGTPLQMDSINIRDGPRPKGGWKA